MGKERHAGPPDVKDRGVGGALHIIGNDVTDSLCLEDVCNLIIYFYCHQLEGKCATRALQMAGNLKKRHNNTACFRCSYNLTHLTKPNWLIRINIWGKVKLKPVLRFPV